MTLVGLRGNEFGRPLSARQLEILTLYAAADSEKEVAARLDLSLQTVKNTLTAAYDRLGVTSRMGAFRRMGWVRVGGLTAPGHVHVLVCYCGYRT